MLQRTSRERFRELTKGTKRKGGRCLLGRGYGGGVKGERLDGGERYNGGVCSVDVFVVGHRVSLES